MILEVTALVTCKVIQPCFESATAAAAWMLPLSEPVAGFAKVASGKQPDKPPKK